MKATELTIFGVSLTLVAIPLMLPDVKVVSDAGSVATILMVITVALPGAAFSLADIVIVFEL